MSNIYDLSDQELLLKSMLFCLDPDDTEDAAQIELIERQLDAIDASANRKILWRVRVLKELQASLEAVEERKRAIERKRTIAQNAVNRMKQNITDCMAMFELERVQDEEFNVSMANTPAALVIAPSFDLRHLPHDCYKIVPETYTPDKNAIKKLLKTGIEYDGLSLVSNKTLRIS